MGYFAIESALLPKGAMSQVLGGCKTDTMHIEKLRKRETGVWFTSRTWQHIHNAPCCGEGPKVDWALADWASQWHTSHQTVLGHLLMEVSLWLPSTWHIPAFTLATGDCIGRSGMILPHVLCTSHLLKELSWVCRWEKPTLALQNHPEVQTAPSPIPICLMKSASQHHLVGPESDVSSTSPMLKQLNDRQVQKKTQTPWSRYGKFSLASLSLCPHTFPPRSYLCLYVRLVPIPGVNSDS